MTRLFIWVVLVVAALVVAATSGLAWTETFASPGGEIDTFYGLPLSWKESIELVCSPVHPQACQSPIYLTIFDWFVFAIDVLFYIGIGYGLFLTYNSIVEKGPGRVRSWNYSVVESSDRSEGMEGIRYR